MSLQTLIMNAVSLIVVAMMVAGLVEGVYQTYVELNKKKA